MQQSLTGVFGVHACVLTGANVCGWSQEKSTTGVTLISGVILSSSPQGRVAEAVFSVTTTDLCIHARLEHADRETEEGFQSRANSSHFLTPHLLSRPTQSLFSPLSGIISAANRCLSIHPSIHLQPDGWWRGNRRRRCGRHSPLSSSCLLLNASAFVLSPADPTSGCGEITPFLKVKPSS